MLSFEFGSERGKRRSKFCYDLEEFKNIWPKKSKAPEKQVWFTGENRHEV